MAERRAWMPSFPGAARGDVGSRPPAAPKFELDRCNIDPPDLSAALDRLEPRAAVELGEDVADVHVDRALAEIQLARDLPVGASHRHQPEHLQLAAAETGAFELPRSTAPQPLRGALAEVLEVRRGDRGERLRSELAGAAVGVCQPLDGNLAAPRGCERACRAQLRVRPLVPERRTLSSGGIFPLAITVHSLLGALAIVLRLRRRA